MEQNLVFEAFKFMLLGMVVVFFFLTIMIYAIKLQAFLINKFFPEKVKINTKKIEQKKDLSITQKKVAAIAAAIHHHNNLKG